MIVIWYILAAFALNALWIAFDVAVYSYRWHTTPPEDRGEIFNLRPIYHGTGYLDDE